MAIYSCYAELRDKVLKLDDRVIFDYNGYYKKCIVYYDALGDGHVFLDNEIFKRLSQTRLLPLGLDPFEFCEQHYSKLPDRWEWFKTHHPNFWPPYQWNDFESITKVVSELFRLIEEPERLAETSEILFID